MSFAMQSFCMDCGRHKRRMPFGEDNPFWDTEQCPRCGSNNAKYVVARGRWFRRGWYDRDGNRVDLPER